MEVLTTVKFPPGMMISSMAPSGDLILLAYKLPLQPTRLRNQVWRKLHALGAVYLQDGVVALPWREDLTENLAYVATTIEEMDGSATLFRACGVGRPDHDKVIERFRKSADGRMHNILTRLDQLESSVPDDCAITGLLHAEEGLKRERVAYLKARRLNYFGSDLEVSVDRRIAAIRAKLDVYARGAK
jgi:hypothetical protein